MAGGFTQAEHGKETGLQRLGQGDYLVFYSPRTSYPDGGPLQEFTAIGRVLDDKPYRVEMTPSFHPWRRRVAYLPARSAGVRPLIDRLSFIPDKRHWGFPFRRGLFEIACEDFLHIAAAMGATLPDAGAA
jgi:hypothetical protein